MITSITLQKIWSLTDVVAQNTQNPTDWLSGFPGQEEDPQISIPPVLPQNMRSFGEWFSVVSSWPAQHLRCLSHDSLPLQTRRQTELGPHAPAALFALPPALCMPLWHMQHSPERQVSPFIHFSLLVQVVAEEKKFKLLQHLALSNLWMSALLMSPKRHSKTYTTGSNGGFVVRHHAQQSQHWQTGQTSCSPDITKDAARVLLVFSFY